MGRCGKVASAEEEEYLICAETKEDRLYFFHVRMVSIIDAAEKFLHKMLDSLS